MEDKKAQETHPETENLNKENVQATDESASEKNENAQEVSGDDDLQKLKDELKEQKEKYLRLYADFDNFRKRSAKERLEYMQMAGKDVMISLLEVLDDCDRAEQQIEKLDESNTQHVMEGVMLVFNKLRSTLQGRGLKPMQSIHTDFDVEKHEAISEIPAPDKKLQGKVIDEIQKGYYLNDKIIRYAKVVVGK